MMRILTFNWHESYIHLLAKTGYQFDVVEKWKGGRFGWIKEFRPVPANCNLISENEAKARLDSGYYDRVIAHNFGDIDFVKDSRIPKVLIFHNKLTTENALGGNKIVKEAYLAQVQKMFETVKGRLKLVYISKAKKDDWEMDGEIILPGIDIDEYAGGWNGDVERVLRVGNLLMERDVMLGYSVQERILKGIPSTVLGLNPRLAGSFIPNSWDDLKGFMRSHRVYLNTTMPPYEDGYNLSMLEAMAVGMPIVSIANPSSPIEDGANGYISTDEEYLRERIEALLKDRSAAEKIGKKGFETVRDQFPIERFVERWQGVLESLGPVPSRISETKRWKVLLSYTANPQTTAAYIEKALRKKHDVMTFGPKMPDEAFKLWDLEAIRDLVKPHDIPYYTTDISEVYRNLPPGWMPDLFLWIESGIDFLMEKLEDVKCLKACYLIDTHLYFDEHVKLAGKFDIVFLAQRAYIEGFREKGITNVYWLPLGCDPETHGKKTDEKIHDIGFVGSLKDKLRLYLLDKLKERFSLYYERCFLGRMAEVFSQSKIVFNNSVNNDLNMRVFEALCSGSMLLTDLAPGSGLTDLFKDRKHLVIYRNDKELVELADYYLKNGDEREKIAAEGMREVLSKHTYEHRVSEMLTIIDLQTREGKRLQEIPTGGDYYRQERRDIEALIPAGAGRILDVGCGEGALGSRLLAKGAKEVVGIEMNPHASEKAKRYLTGVMCGDVEDSNLPFDEGYFDCIIFADVLEHLKDPLSTLKKFKRHLSDSGEIVASIPNVRYYGVINMLVEGYWRYEDFGILDRTHLRFFTKKEMEKLFADAGFEITGIAANMDPAYNSLDPLAGEIAFGRTYLRGMSPDEKKDLFVIQYLIKAKKAGQEIKNAGDAATLGNLDDARRTLDEYLEAHPADLDALYKHAEVCYRLGLRDKAVESLERLLIFQPDRAEALELKKKLLEG